MPVELRAGILPDPRGPPSRRKNAMFQPVQQFFARLFQPVLHFLDRFGNVVGRTLMTVIYFIAVAPVALIYKLFTDTLVLKPPKSTFREWSAVNETLDDARRQD